MDINPPSNGELRAFIAIHYDGTTQHFHWADSSTVEHLNGIEKMAVQFRPCPPCFQDGRVAQLAERFLAMEEVAGSSPVSHSIFEMHRSFNG